MAVTVMPINQVTVPARQNRQAFAALMMPGPGPLRTRSGFRPGGEPVVTVTAATWSVDPFSSIVDTGQSSVTGPYLVASDATESGNMTPADQTYARKDILYLQLDDGPDEDASGQRRGRVLYLAGVASANPAVPATPPRSFLVRTIDVPKAGGGAPAVTNTAPYTVASGGLLPVRNQAEEDAITPIAYDGMPIWRIDQGWIRVRRGNAWMTFAPALACENYNAVGFVAGQNVSAVAYTDVTGASRAITKQLTQTRLKVRVTASGYTSSAAFLVTYAVNIAGVDYPVVLSAINVNGTHYTLSGETIIPAGIAAGAQTAQLRCKLNTAGHTWTMDFGDSISMTIEEVV